MAINYNAAHDRMTRRQNGETVHEPDEQYKVLKAMEPQIDEMYRNGEIKQQKYDSYKRSLQRWEEMMKDGE